MGTISFHIPETLTPTERKCLERASWCGVYPGSIDLTPVPTQRRIENNKIFLTKLSGDSGFVAMPWPIGPRDCPVIMSATIREREEPYHLLLELARGKLNQVRNQLAEWDEIGLQVMPEERLELLEASRKFGRVVLGPNEPDAVKLIREVLAAAYVLAERITRQFAEQLLGTRLSDPDAKLGTVLGCRISELPSPEDQAVITNHFTAVRLIPNWREIEPNEARYDWTKLDALVDWAVGTGLTVSFGPLIDLTHGSFPDWSSQWVGDLPSLSAFTCDFVETVMRRYNEKIRWWHVLSGFNHQDAMGLVEDDRIRLAARILESARQTDADALLSIGLAKPWGDYLISEDYTYSPLVFADTLVRAGFTFASIELEVLFGSGPRSSGPRDALEIYKLLDQFSILGIPLEVVLGSDLRDPNTLTFDDDPPRERSLETMSTSLVLAASLPQVCGVFWEDWSIRQAERIPGAALNATNLGSGIGLLYLELRKHLAKRADEVPAAE